MSLQDQIRAAAPRTPLATPELERALAERTAHRGVRALRERRSMARGLLLLAAAVLLASVARAGAHRVFLPGWWRHW